MLGVTVNFIDSVSSLVWARFSARAYAARSDFATLALSTFVFQAASSIQAA